MSVLNHQQTRFPRWNTVPIQASVHDDVGALAAFWQALAHIPWDSRRLIELHNWVYDLAQDKDIDRPASMTSRIEALERLLAVLVRQDNEPDNEQIAAVTAILDDLEWVNHNAQWL